MKLGSALAFIVLTPENVRGDWMESLVLVDSNVWLDYLLDRRNHIRPLGELAYAVFKKGAECKFMIIMTDYIMREIEKCGFKGEVKEIVEELYLAKKVIFQTVSAEDLKTATELKKRGVHWMDAIHAATALNNRYVIVTRNIRDFENIEGLRVILPEGIHSLFPG